jgi:murein DD-endopeptidase MepM/ murein hydrolase activator NlpD
MAIRHFGHGCVVCQPVTFLGVLPCGREIGCGAVCARSDIPEPIPVIAQTEVLRLQDVSGQEMQSREAPAMAYWRKGWLLIALMAFGVIVGTSAQATAIKGFMKQRAHVLKVASVRDALVSDNEIRGQPLGRGRDLHANIADATSPGDPVAAPVSGRVVFAAPFKGYGPSLIIQHGAYHTVLWGFARLEVVVDDLVAEGQTIGLIRGQSEAAPVVRVESWRDGHPIDLKE